MKYGYGVVAIGMILAITWGLGNLMPQLFVADHFVVAQSITSECVNQDNLLVRANGEDIFINLGDTPLRQDFCPGDNIVITERNDVWQFVDSWRLPWTLTALVLFLIASLVVTRGKSWKSMVGLGFTVVILIAIVLPMLINGVNPLVVALLASTLILFGGIGFGHRWHTGTLLGLGCIALTLVTAFGLALLFTQLSFLFGMGSEAAYTGTIGLLSDIDYRGIYLCAIVLGTLGILDDIVMTQVAIVVELKSTDHHLAFRDLYTKAVGVGHTHIFALVNTLALAYFASALPLLMLVSADNLPLWVTLNSEIVSEEILRTVIGSLGLVLAVPITTFVATWYCQKKGVIEGLEGHGHSHGHHH